MKQIGERWRYKSDQAHYIAEIYSETSIKIIEIDFAESDHFIGRIFTPSLLSLIDHYDASVWTKLLNQNNPKENK